MALTCIIFQLTLWFSADPLLHLDPPVSPLVGKGLRLGLQAFPHDPRRDLRVLDVAEIKDECTAFSVSH